MCISFCFAVQASSQLLLACIPKSCITPKLMEDLWARLCESFQAMASGRCPTTKRRFRPGVIYCITGDMEFFYQEFQFPRPNQANPCLWCACIQEGEDCWNDFHQEAGWRRTTLSPGQLEARLEHPLFQVQGVNAQALKLDVLHVLDLGVSCHVVGNLLWEIIEDSKPGSRNSNMSCLNAEIQEIYQELGIPSGTRLPNLKWKSDLATGANDYPCLKHQKGRRIRHFMPVAVELARRYSV